MGADRSRDNQPFDVAIAEEIVKVAGTLHSRIQTADVIAALGVEVAGDHSSRLSELMKITDPVGTPITETDDPDAVNLIAGFLARVALTRLNDIRSDADRTQSHHFTHDPRS